MADPLSSALPKKPAISSGPLGAAAAPTTSHLTDVDAAFGALGNKPVGRQPVMMNESGAPIASGGYPVGTIAAAPMPAGIIAAPPLSTGGTMVISAPPVATPSSTPTHGSHLSTPTPTAGSTKKITSSPRSAGTPFTKEKTQFANVTFDDQHAAEIVHHVVKECYLLNANPFCEVKGRLLVTNFRLRFQTPKGSLREELKWMQTGGFFDVCLGGIEDHKTERQVTTAGVQELKLKVVTKDLRHINFMISAEIDIERILDLIAAFGQPGNPTLLFAFKYAEEMWKTHGKEEIDGWSIYDPLREYDRLGISAASTPDGAPWVASDINRGYELCSSYPANLVFPKAMSHTELRAVASFRKRGRLPSMSWCSGPQGGYASLWRCSQSTEGLLGKGCPEDEKLIECIRTGGGNGKRSRFLLVVDLRPKRTAWANKAGGGGFEGYSNCRLTFGGIENVHRVREAWHCMGDAVRRVNEGEIGTWWKDVAHSCWYEYLSSILNSALLVVNEMIIERCNAMIHCSDGWDRTAQVAATAMLCCDPYYRTMRGFAILVQKEFCSYGHKFRTRLATGEKPTSEYSPIFIQWLECVYQLTVQNPTSFEFSQSFLLLLANEAISNRYGTFLTDCEKERNEIVKPSCISIWSQLLVPETRVEHRNDLYTENTMPIVPIVSQAHLKIWEEYWFRFHPSGQRFQRQRMGQADWADRPAEDAGKARGATSKDEKALPNADSATAAAGAVGDAALMVGTSAWSGLSSLAGVAAGFAANQAVNLASTASDYLSEQNKQDTPTVGEFLASTQPAPRPSRPAPKNVFGDDDGEDIFSQKSPASKNLLLPENAPGVKPVSAAAAPPAARQDDNDEMLL